MPPTTPISGYRALFSRDPISGEIFQIATTSPVETLNDLIDVTTSVTGPTGPTGPSDGQVLVWDAALGQWVPGSQASSLDDLTDVTTSATGPSGPTGPADGQVLLWDEAAGQWVPGIASIVGVLDDLADVDTSTNPPLSGNALVYDGAGQWVPGKSQVDFWDPTVNYLTDDMVLWPETAPSSLWKTQRDSFGEEPVAGGGNMVPTGLLFPGSTGTGNDGPNATPLGAAYDDTTGLDIRIATNGIIGTQGGFVSTWSSSGDQLYTVYINGTELEFDAYGATYRRPLSSFSSHNFIRVVVTNTTIDFYGSANGSVWDRAGAQEVVFALLAGLSNRVHIGHTGDGVPASNYDSIIRTVEIYDVTGATLMLSWDRNTQPDALGAGISPATGETWVITGTVVDDPPPGTQNPWLQLVGGASKLDDLSDVNTSMPTPVNGDSLIWDDATQQWVPGIPSGADEVVVGPNDPLVTDPASEVEMWYDTASPPPPGLSAAIDWWDPTINYVETDRTLWPQDDPAVWSALYDHTDEEPGVIKTAPTFYTFAGGTTGPVGLYADTAPNVFANGVDLRVFTNGTLGTTGTLATVGNSDEVTLAMTGSGNEMTALIKVTAGQDITLTGTPYDPTIDTIIRVRVDFGTLTVSLDSSDDGLGWITLDSVTYLAGTDPLVASANAVHIGHDSTDTNNYNGTLGEVFTLDPSTDTTLSMWSPVVQGANGTGPSPTTGENYVMYSGTVLTPAGIVDLPNPWYLLGEFTGPYLPLTGGTVEGDVTFNGDLYVEGTLSAGDVIDRSALATKSEVADLDPGAAGRLIDAIRPITFRRSDGPMRRVGFAVEDIEGSGETDLVERLIRSDGDPGDRGWSVAGMVSVLVAEVQRLRAEVAALKKNGA